MNDMVIHEAQRGSLMSAQDLRIQVNAIQQAMQAVMKDGTHFGKIPGTQKPTLYKAGSEILLTMFHIAVDPEVDDLSNGDHIRYRVRCVGRHQASGIVVGVGIGEASTAEEKYAWRGAVCDEEYEATEGTRRRIKFSKYQGKVEQRKQVRTNAADLANTVLKMAKKRAQIDMTLTSTAASDIFTQDIEDLPAELQTVADESPVLDPKVKADLLASLEEHQGVDDLRKRLQNAMKIARDAGDVEAHKDIKNKGVELQMKLATTRTNGKPAEDVQTNDDDVGQ